MEINDQIVKAIVKEATPGIVEAIQAATAKILMSDPQREKTDRFKPRIVAALQRAGDYAHTYPGMAEIFKYKAMTKTLLRRALGGNTVNIDPALDELVAEGKVKHHPAFIIGVRPYSVYELIDKG